MFKKNCMKLYSLIENENHLHCGGVVLALVCSWMCYCFVVAPVLSAIFVNDNLVGWVCVWLRDCMPFDSHSGPLLNVHFIVVVVVFYREQSEKWLRLIKSNGYGRYSLLPSQATIFTLSTRANSCTSRNSTSFSINVQTLSQNRYVFNLAALNVTRALTFVLSAVFMDLSNWSRTLSASCGVICPNFRFAFEISMEPSSSSSNRSANVCMYVCERKRSIHVNAMEKKRNENKIIDYKVWKRHEFHHYLIGWFYMGEFNHPILIGCHCLAKWVWMTFAIDWHALQLNWCLSSICTSLKRVQHFVLINYTRKHRRFTDDKYLN